MTQIGTLCKPHGLPAIAGSCDGIGEAFHCSAGCRCWDTVECETKPETCQFAKEAAVPAKGENVMSADEVDEYCKDRRLRFLDIASDGYYSLVGPGAMWQIYLNEKDQNWYLRCLTATTFLLKRETVKEALL